MDEKVRMNAFRRELTGACAMETGSLETGNQIPESLFRDSRKKGRKLAFQLHES